MDGALTVEEGHAIADAIEKEIRQRLSIVSTIHMEPIDGSSRDQDSAPVRN